MGKRIPFLFYAPFFLLPVFSFPLVDRSPDYAIFILEFKVVLLTQIPDHRTT